MPSGIRHLLIIWFCLARCIPSAVVDMAPMATPRQDPTSSPASKTGLTEPSNPTKRAEFHAPSTEAAIGGEHDHAAHNYHPLPVVFARASGTSVWDPEGRHYLDFLSSYSAVNQGHCHPELVKALTEQASTLTLSSRAFYNDVFPKFAEFVTQYFGYDTILPMNTGAEAVETGIKIARKWGYKVKGIPHDEAIVLCVENNFHGRTVSVVVIIYLYTLALHATTDVPGDCHSLLPSRYLRTPSRGLIMAPTCPTSEARSPEQTDRSLTTTRRRCAKPSRGPARTSPDSWWSQSRAKPGSWSPTTTT